MVFGCFLNYSRELFVRWKTEDDGDEGQTGMHLRKGYWNIPTDRSPQK
jgi:hypothetical protein